MPPQNEHKLADEWTLSMHLPTGNGWPPAEIEEIVGNIDWSTKIRTEILEVPISGLSHKPGYYLYLYRLYVSQGLPPHEFVNKALPPII